MLIKQVINQTTNFSALITIEGMLSGYFSSPLIHDYGLDHIVKPIQSVIESQPEIVGDLLAAIARQKFAVNEAHHAGVNEVIVGYHTLGGVKFPIIKHRELTVDDIKPFI